ncbi:hypothetical protein myaer102_12260 [Microcystis viridis NIES-102]|uniref:Uncharacterized protein n=1 Tax=Microcystis viridis NIES-102 TaxID=213615 RepID=A0A3G9JLF7_MICVR|nr:hypothetical protein myaer102_12260 [Microcystis viridis NIES-102]
MLGEAEKLSTKSEEASIGDFSCYVTIINRTNTTLTLTSQQNDCGSYNPAVLPPQISAQGGQVFFALKGGLAGGTEGTVTYSVLGKGKLITFSYSCPPVSDNNISVPFNQSSFTVNYYGTNQTINWNPDGSNWGPANNFPTRGHPLFVLFVVNELQ